ncbi:hypothetical protein [uncultured Paraglaciecola sp.]|jgi:hypothetical protein|uniref:hypothetical protein n=1 Tax=uncultured Paraglaciecola sp. TaxID=1765024 RepID=UPI0025D02658|nr:hypothetical protein [uncultured Paraglaciecola sp.]
MNKRGLIKYHLSQLSLRELLRYRLLLCSGEPNENIELDVVDLFKYPARLETSYFDNWQRDVLKTLFRLLDEEFQTSSLMDKKITELLSKQTFSEKDERTLLLFENFMVSLKSNNVVSIHSLLHNKLDNLKF